MEETLEAMKLARGAGARTAKEDGSRGVGIASPTGRGSGTNGSDAGRAWS
jgi:hypothetical protein